MTNVPKHLIFFLIHSAIIICHEGRKEKINFNGKK